MKAKATTKKGTRQRTEGRTPASRKHRSTTHGQATHASENGFTIHLSEQPNGFISKAEFPALAKFNDRLRDEYPSNPLASEAATVTDAEGNTVGAYRIMDTTNDDGYLHIAIEAKKTHPDQISLPALRFKALQKDAPLVDADFMEQALAFINAVRDNRTVQAIASANDNPHYVSAVWISGFTLSGDEWNSNRPREWKTETPMLREETQGWLVRLQHKMGADRLTNALQERGSLHLMEQAPRLEDIEEGLDKIRVKRALPRKNRKTSDASDVPQQKFAVAEVDADTQPDSGISHLALQRLSETSRNV